MKLYDYPGAPNPRRVKIFAHEKDIKLELINCDMLKREHKTPEFLKKSPSGKIPVLELEDGRCISESVAICRYLESIVPEPNLFGENPIEIASIEIWYSRVTYELVVPLMHGFRHTHPHMSQMENQNQEYGLAQRELAVKSLDVYDKIIASREYIAGERFTYADIQMVTSLQFLVRLNRLDINDYENLNDYINQVSSRSSFSV